MKILKKNQVIIFVTALMLVTAGYLNYTARADEKAVSGNVVEGNQIAGIGDAKLVSNNNVVEENNNEIGEALSTGNNEIANTTVSDDTNKVQQTNANTTKTKDDYFVTSRLGRDTMYSQMLESYQKILENANIAQDQKTVASQEIEKINSTKNAIMISENLIKTKGFEDVIIFVNDKSISVIVKGEAIEQDKIAQIQNVVAREMSAEIENIHISNK